VSGGFFCHVSIIGARNEHEKTNVTDEHGVKMEKWRGWRKKGEEKTAQKGMKKVY
jgi:hypothetical protein